MSANEIVFIMKSPMVYIMANKKNGTLYTGVTSNLLQRVYQHKHGLLQSFAHKYGCKMLVFFEPCETMPYAILREKQIKGGSRKAKLKLIEALNPTWEDLYSNLM